MEAATRLRWAAPLLLLATLVVYVPAIDRVFAGDQLWYFAELDGDTTLTAGLRHYDYAATRRYLKADDLLFRPLLFVLLAVENSLFSYHHQWWNAANLALHALTAVCFFNLLVAIKPSPFALPAALLFVVLKPSVELVLWNHLGGYILAGLFLMIGIRAWVLMSRRPDRTPYLTAVYALSFIAASLCHETMTIAALLAAILLVGVEWHRGSRPGVGRTMALFSPVAVFSVLYFVHALRVDRLTSISRGDEEQVFAMGNALALVPTTVNVMAHWVSEMGLPSGLKLDPSSFNGLTKTVEFSWHTPLLAMNVFLVVVAAIVLGASVSWNHLKRLFPVLVLLLGTAFAYTAGICFGRGQVSMYPHYPYLFCPLLLAFMYAAMDFDHIRTPIARAVAMVALAFIVLHATQSRAVAGEIGRLDRSPSRYLTAVGRFVDNHREEADFSFAIAEPPADEDPVIEMTEGYGDEPTSVVRRRRVTEILFGRFYDSSRPKYVLRCQPSSADQESRQWTCASQLSFRPSE